MNTHSEPPDKSRPDDGTVQSTNVCADITCESESPQSNCDGRPMSFDAYPLEYTSELLQNENQVVYMLVSPSDVPLSFSHPSSNAPHVPSHLDSETQHPICHGVFFPCSTAEVATSADEQSESFSLPSTGGVASQGTIDNGSGAHNPASLECSQTHLGMLILQQLMALQYALQTGTSVLPNQNYPPNRPIVTTESHRLAEPTSPMASSLSDRSTYLVPVDATFKEDAGISLHITPREQFTQTDHAGEVSGVKIDCPNNHLVLYPYSSAPKLSTENFETQKINGADSQAYTINCLRQCIHRGSLDVQCEQNKKFVDTVKGCKKPGFVLLSVRREPVISDDQLSVDTVLQPACFDIHSMSTTTTGSVAEKAKPVECSQSSKRIQRRKYHVSRCDTDSRRRSLKKSSRSSLKASRAPEIREEESPHCHASTSTSRFRVSRFADKKQTWVAPVGAGCFIVHDLWTTKLPDYVICNTDESKWQKLLQTNESKESTVDVSATSEVGNTECLVCQYSQLAMPCECGKVQNA